MIERQAQRSDLFRRAGGAILAVGLVLAMTGCVEVKKPGSAAPPPPPPAPAAAEHSAVEPKLDPTADHLQDLSGRLLTYYAVHREMPARLTDVMSVAPEGENPPEIDPATGKPLVYNPEGIALQNVPDRIIVYQSAATGQGGRWVVLMRANRGKPEMRVQRLPEAAFSALGR